MTVSAGRRIDFNLYSAPPPWLVWRPPSAARGPWCRVLVRPRRRWRTGRRRRTARLAVAALVAGGALLGIVLLAGYAGTGASIAPRSAGRVVPEAPQHAPPATRETSLGGFVPARLVIPSIGVDAPVDATGMTDGGVMEEPADHDHAGWFEFSARAGERGSAVLAGHRDREDGPALFWDVHTLEPGDEVTVVGEDGRGLTYRVEEIETYGYRSVPMERLFAADRPRLNLITCTGDFDPASRNYQERLVVYAVLPE
jgi:sortase (surface protein transpeptidase)